MTSFKILLCSFILFTGTTIYAKSSEAKRVSNDPDPIEIIVEQPMDDSGAPRSSVYNPFTAWLDGLDVELYSADATYGTVAECIAEMM